MIERAMEAFDQGVREEVAALLRACLALFLGGLVGWERESSGKWAGLRTHMLVCLASMMFIRVGQFLVEDSMADLRDSALRMDPVRLVEAIVTGVAFLGAGTIFRDTQSRSMRGLTTAASLLVVAPVGIAVAVEKYVFAVGATMLALLVLRILRRVEGAGALSRNTDA